MGDEGPATGRPHWMGAAAVVAASSSFAVGFDTEKPLLIMFRLIFIDYNFFALIFFS